MAELLPVDWWHLVVRRMSSSGTRSSKSKLFRKSHFFTGDLGEEVQPL